MTSEDDSSTTSQRWVPTPIGGFPTQVDFAPSIIFLILFIFSLSPWIKRQFDPNTRTITLGFLTFLFVLGRMFLYNLRLFEAEGNHSKPKEDIKGGGAMIIYEQMGFALGYIGVMLDLVAFARAVLVNATLEDLQRGSKDRSTLRSRIRWILWYPAFALFAFSVYGTLTYGLLVQSGRYICDLGALITILVFVGGLLYVRPRIEFLDKGALDAIIKLSLSVAVIPLYRLTVLHYYSPSLTIAPSPPYPTSSLTSTQAKAVFYTCHALPEVLVVYYIHCTNIRAKFNTGPYGDWYHDDAKHGVPQLREEGIIVQGVGVPPAGQPQKPTFRWWLRFLFCFERRPRRKNYDEVEFDPDRESLLTLVPTRT